MWLFYNIKPNMTLWLCTFTEILGRYDLLVEVVSNTVERSFVAGLLCLWVHASGLFDSHHRNGVCDDCRDVLLVEC